VLGLVLVLFVAFGVLVEVRSAFQQTSKTDFGVYARAAWAIREGEDPYRVTDDNGWHYCYPPPLAVLLAPLADPLPDRDRTGYLPFAASVALWYLFCTLCVVWAGHRLAAVLVPDATLGTRRWWYARAVPLYVCAGGIGFTLGRGQVNTLLVALICGAFAASVAGRRLASGLWLAGAIALKVIPGYLLLDPLVRRDRRAFVGVAVGSVLLFGVLPAAVWGPAGAVEMNRKVLDQVLAPGATGAGDQTRAKELTEATATDSQSFQAVIHAHLYPDVTTRPTVVDRSTRLAHWGIGGVLTLVTAVVGWRRFRSGPVPAADRLVYLGCLCVLMMLLTPVSHMHYYAMGFPLVAGLWLRALAARPGAVSADRRTTAVLVGWGVCTALPLFPGPFFDRIREAGFGGAATLALWAFALRALARPAAAARAPAAPAPLRAAA
jgi:hypothetical protein